jgi:2-haloacid dehalogenase
MDAGVTDVVFGLDGLLVEWDGRLPIVGQYPQSIADMMFNPSDEWGMGFHLAMLESGWDEERVLASYEKHHGPAIAWVLRMYLEHEMDGFVGMMPGMSGILRDLNSAGIRLWQLANATSKHWKLAQRRFSELRMFQDAVISADEGLRLPDPVLVRRAIARFGVDPDTTVVVYNNVRIVKTLENMGLQAIMFTDADALRGKLI